jgi:hypothetical protein
MILLYGDTLVVDSKTVPSPVPINEVEPTSLATKPALTTVVAFVAVRDVAVDPPIADAPLAPPVSTEL